MSFTDEDVQLAVKHGVCWLDENHPEWVSRIDLSQLRMQSCENCVIGQAVGEYYRTIAAGWTQETRKSFGAAGGRILEPEYDRYDWAIAQGFQSPRFLTGTWTDFDEMDRYYEKLEEVWSDEVRKRLG